MRAPGVALGRKNSVASHFGKYGSNAGITGEGFGPRPQDLITPLRVREHHGVRQALPEQVHRSILDGPAFEDEVKLRQVELVDVAQKRQPSRTWQIVQCALCHDPARPARKPRNVDEDGAPAFDDGTRGEALRPAFALSRVDAEAPAMVSADKLVSVELALSEQRALVRTAPLEGSQPSRGPHDDDVESVRRERVRAIAVKLIQVGNAGQ